MATTGHLPPDEGVAMAQAAFAFREMERQQAALERATVAAQEFSRALSALNGHAIEGIMTDRQYGQLMEHCEALGQQFDERRHKWQDDLVRLSHNLDAVLQRDATVAAFIEAQQNQAWLVAAVHSGTSETQITWVPEDVARANWEQGDKDNDH